MGSTSTARQPGGTLIRISYFPACGGAAAAAGSWFPFVSVPALACTGVHVCPRRRIPRSGQARRGGRRKARVRYFTHCRCFFLPSLFLEIISFVQSLGPPPSSSRMMVFSCSFLYAQIFRYCVWRGCEAPAMSPLCSHLV